MSCIQISDDALNAFKRQIQSAANQPSAVRIGVRGGACNGLQYVIEFDYVEIPRSTDTIIQIDDTIQLRIDKKSLLYLSGAQITWKKTLMREGFEFHNPNELTRCGCGNSFSVK